MAGGRRVRVCVCGTDVHDECVTVCHSVHIEANMFLFMGTEMQRSKNRDVN